MKKAIQQILESINNEPEKWTPCTYYSNWDAIKKDGVLVGGSGNTKMLSIINVKIDNINFEVNWLEKYYLEKAVLNFYKHCNLALMDTTNE